MTAASDWDGPAERKRVRRALPGSYEELFHERAAPTFCWSTPADLRRVGGSSARSASSTGRRPSAARTTSTPASRASSTPSLHFDETRAVEPLERTSEWEAGELPETYPWGV